MQDRFLGLPSIEPTASGGFLEVCPSSLWQGALWGQPALPAALQCVVVCCRYPPAANDCAVPTMHWGGGSGRSPPLQNFSKRLGALGEGGRSVL